MNKPVYCYIILCEDSSFYTGWTKNIASRFEKHRKGTGSRYTRVHPPQKVIYWETCVNSSNALKKEIKIKKLDRTRKKNLILRWKSKMNLPDEFNKYEYLSIAPGRVNLIGEHIDYNGGPVLPAAIDRYVYLGANKLNFGEIKIKSLDFNQSVSISLESIDEKKDITGDQLPDWALYPAGVIWVAKNKNLKINPFEAIFTSSVPIGAGLSSSAAVEVAFAAFLREENYWDLDNLELSQLCQTAENNYIGVNCGLMDQFASVNGIEGSALYLDTTSNNWFPVKLPNDIALVITNSKLPRTLSGSEYNLRRTSCERALIEIQNDFPTIKNLTELIYSQFEKIKKRLDPIDAKRVQHVINETERVKMSIELLQNKEILQFGKLMISSHESLRDLYEVSTPELDLLVSTAIEIEGCYGSRLTGAGFGGCVISLVDKKNVPSFIKQLDKAYYSSTGIKPETYICQVSNGVEVKWRDKNQQL